MSIGDNYEQVAQLKAQVAGERDNVTHPIAEQIYRIRILAAVEPTLNTQHTSGTGHTLGSKWISGPWIFQRSC